MGGGDKQSVHLLFSFHEWLYCYHNYHGWLGLSREGIISSRQSRVVSGKGADPAPGIFGLMAAKGQNPMAFSIWGLQGWAGGCAIFLPVRTIHCFMRALGPVPGAPGNDGNWWGRMDWGMAGLEAALTGWWIDSRSTHLYKPQ